LLTRINSHVAKFVDDPSHSQLQRFITINHEEDIDAHSSSVEVLISSQAPSTTVPTSEESAYEVETLLEYGVKAGHPSFLVKWMGYDAHHATWHRVWDLLQDGLEPLITSFMGKWNSIHHRHRFPTQKAQLQCVLGSEVRDGDTYWEIKWIEASDGESSWQNGQRIPFTTHNARIILEYERQNGNILSYDAPITKILHYETRCGTPYFLVSWGHNDEAPATWKTVWELISPVTTELVIEFIARWNHNNPSHRIPNPDRKIATIYTSRPNIGGNLYLVTWQDEPYNVYSVREEGIPFNPQNASLILEFKRIEAKSHTLPSPREVKELAGYDIQQNIPCFNVIWQNARAPAWVSVWELLLGGLEVRIWAFMEHWNKFNARSAFSLRKAHIKRIMVTGRPTTVLSMKLSTYKGQV
jgi:hypothetical protein